MNLKKKALILAYITVGYTLFEGMASIFFGFIAHSKSLIGFGLDSVIESVSSMIIVWQFIKTRKLSSKKHEEALEERAEKYVGYTFFPVAIYVLFESGKSILHHETPDKSIPGIVLTILAIVVMITLYIFKDKVAKALQSDSLIADAKQTIICAGLSFTVLIGLVLNYIFGIGEVDAIIGLLLGLYLLREGYNIVTEKYNI